MKISVVIPNYNGSKLLKANLSKVLSVVADAEVIIVDDASTDDSLTILKRQFPQVKVIAREKNEGFASTVNDGVKNASGDLILLLNSDVYPEKDFLKYLTPHFQDPQVFAVGFLQKSPENGKVILRGRGVGKFERGFLVHARGEVDDGAIKDKDTSEVASLSRAKSRETPRMVEESKKTLWVSGGAGIYRKKIWQELRGMNTLYNPFYWEDIDLSYRALKSGYKLIFEPGSVVIHDQEKSVIKSLYTPRQVKTIAYRNQILFVWLNITDFKLILNHLIWLPYHLCKSLVTGDLVFVKAFLMALFRMPSVLSVRNRKKKLTEIPDEKILLNLNQ